MSRVISILLRWIFSQMPACTGLETVTNSMPVSFRSYSTDKQLLVLTLSLAYAADGYARIKGISALVTTFGVGT